MGRFFQRVDRLSLVTLLAMTACADPLDHSVAASSAAPGEVIARARLGNNTEDITFIDRGPMANHVIAIDGGEVMDIPTEGSRPPTTLFETFSLGLPLPSRGVGYVSADSQLVFNDLVQRDHLLFTDLAGNHTGDLTIHFTGGYFPDHIEGITLMPRSSPYPGAIAMVTWSFATGLEVRVEIIDRTSGDILHELIVDPSIAGNGVTALAFERGHFLVAAVNRTIYAVGLDGLPVAPPVEISELHSIEGIAVAHGGLYAAGYASGKLIGLDRDLGRRPQRDRDFLVGLGLSRLAGMAWDDDSDSFRVAAQISEFARIAAVGPGLGSFEVSATLDEGMYGQLFDVGVIPAEDLLVACTAYGPNALRFIDDAGEISSDLDFGFNPPGRVAYIEATNELAVVFLAEPQVIHILSRAGDETRSIDLGAFGIASVSGLDVDDNGGDPHLVVAGGAEVLELDLDGQLLHSADYTDSLGPTYFVLGDLAVVRSGPDAGALAFDNGETNEVVIVGRQ